MRLANLGAPSVRTASSDAPALPPIDETEHGAGCSVVAICERWRSLGQPARCTQEVPARTMVADDHCVACHFAQQ